MAPPSKPNSPSVTAAAGLSQPLPDQNARAPVAGSKFGEQRAPPLSESSRATSEAAPHGVKRKVRSGAVPMEENTPTPVAEPAWYDSPDIDEDYRFFLRHVSLVNDKLVYKDGNSKITIGDHSDAEEEDGLPASEMPILKDATEELQGVIWPPHINERPNSVFKDKLIEFLIKPYTQEEYDRYFELATTRTPMVKERMTRNNVVSYQWMHEMGKSYFDWYPDLAEQFNLQRNNYPNGLALLRGLFFWLQNIEKEDQFRPWSDEFKKYRVVTTE